MNSGVYSIVVLVLAPKTGDLLIKEVFAKQLKRHNHHEFDLDVIPLVRRKISDI